MDDLDDAARAVAWQKWPEHGLSELQVADHEKADADDDEDGRACPVRPELERDVKEDAREADGLVDLLQGVGDTEHEDELGGHQQEKPTFDLKTGRQPAQPRPG